MKKLFSISGMLLLCVMAAYAQVNINRAISLTGSGSDAKVTGIQEVNSSTDAVSVEKVQSGSLVFATNTVYDALNNRYVLTFTPPITALTTGMIINFKADAANTATPAASIKVDALTPKTLKKEVTWNLDANDIGPNQLVSVVYDGVNFQTVSRLGFMWTTSGNAGTSSSTNYIGTTDAQDVVMKAGTEGLRLMNGGVLTALGTGTAVWPATTSAKSSLVFRGATSNFNINLDDGSKTSMLWNATGTAGTYLASAEGAVKLGMGTNNPTGGQLTFHGAAAGTAGNAITWTQMGLLSSADKIWFSPRGTSNDFMINSSGNVGIASSSPAYKMEVRTDGTTNAIGVRNTSGQDLAFISHGASTSEGQMCLYHTTNGLRVQLNANGQNYFMDKVGIGTSGPGYKLEVRTDGVTNAIGVRNASGQELAMMSHGAGTAEGQLVLNHTTNGMRVQLNGNGQNYFADKVGIGNTASAKLDVTGTSNNMTLQTNGGRVMFVPSSSSATQGVQIEVSTLASGSNALFFNVANGWTGNIMSFNYNGGARYRVDYTGAVYALSYNPISDHRLKTNIRTLDDKSGLAAIKKLNPVSYNWIDTAQDAHLQIGFIAQQVQQVFPDLVTKSGLRGDIAPGGALAINYTGIIPPIVKAVQEQQAMIEAIEAENKSLRNELEQLKAMVLSGKYADNGAKAAKE